MNLIRKRLKKIIARVGISGFENSSDIIESGYFLDYAINDECYENWNKLENYINKLSDEEQNAIINFNKNKNISNVNDIIQISADLINANQVPRELKPVMSGLEKFNYISYSDAVNCACAFTNNELKIIQKFDNDEEKIIKNIKKIVDESGKDFEDLDIDSIVEEYITRNYPNYVDLCGGSGSIDGTIDAISNLLEKKMYENSSSEDENVKLLMSNE